MSSTGGRQLRQLVWRSWRIQSLVAAASTVLPFLSVSVGCAPCARSKAMIRPCSSLAAGRAGIAATRVLDGEVQRGGAGLVHEPRIGSVVDEGLDGLRGTSANGAMERRRAVVVEGVGVRPRVDQKGHHVMLCHGIPVRGAGTAIGGVVERFRSPSVPSSHRGAVGDERLRELWLERGGGDVQGRVAGVDVVPNGGQEVGAGIAAGRADPN